MIRTAEMGFVSKVKISNDYLVVYQAAQLYQEPVQCVETNCDQKIIIDGGQHGRYCEQVLLITISGRAGSNLKSGPSYLSEGLGLRC